MRSWIFFLAILLNTIQEIVAQTATERDTLCAFISKSLPVFPEINKTDSATILVTQYETKPNRPDTALYIVVTNRELIRTRYGLTYSNNCNNELAYLAVSRTNNSYQIQACNSLEEALKIHMPADEYLIYAHGYGRTFNSILEESEKIKRFYNVPLIVFDWPSKYPNMFELRSYLYSRNNLKSSCSHFAQFLKDYQKYVQKNEVHKPIYTSLILHSMGNALLEQSIKQNLLTDLDINLLDNIILNAAAIRKSGHRKWLANTHLSRNIYVISNYNDPTLYGVYWLTLRKQLGRSAIKKQANNIKYINLGHIAGGYHNYFINKELMQNHPELKILYFKMLTKNNLQELEKCSELLLTKEDTQE